MNNKTREIEKVLDMLAVARGISMIAIQGYADLIGHPAFKLEGLPELLRAQEQNATALISQAEKLWRIARENAGRED